MKNRKVLANIIVTLIALTPLMIFGVWHFYMKSTIDNHIISQKQYHKIKKQGDDKWVALTAVEIQNLPNEYRGQLEIKKENGEYYWIDGDTKQKLIRTFEKRNQKSGGHEFPDSTREKWFVYSSVDRKLTANLLTNKYEISKCYISYGDGLLYVDSVMENGDLLRYWAHVPVYENIWQYEMCRHYMPHTGTYSLKRGHDNEH